MQVSAALAPSAHLCVLLSVCNWPMAGESWWQCLVQVADSVKDLSPKCVARCNEFGIEPLMGAQVRLFLQTTAFGHLFLLSMLFSYDRKAFIGAHE